MADDPFVEFKRWFAGVLEAGVHEPNAFVLATVDADGTPSARAVLMKDLSEGGLVFYTGMKSRKSQALRANRKAAATFVWTILHRQVRFEGVVSEVAPEQADAYFATRHRESQIGACASRQSRPLASRAALEAEVARLTHDFQGSEVRRPDYWRGYRLVPLEIEFWKAGAFRLHDRIVFRRASPHESWTKTRLYP
jgi:pyridoxamine 5'-phosphate oxidase